MGLLANKSALVSVSKTKHEKATCTHLTSQADDLVEFNTFFIHVADVVELTKLIGMKNMQAVI